MITRAETGKQGQAVSTRRGGVLHGVHACAIVVSMPLMAWSTGKGAARLWRLALPFGIGKGQAGAGDPEGWLGHGGSRREAPVDQVHGGGGDMPRHGHGACTRQRGQGSERAALVSG